MVGTWETSRWSETARGLTICFALLRLCGRASDVDDVEGTGMIAWAD